MRWRGRDGALGLLLLVQVEIKCSFFVFRWFFSIAMITLVRRKDLHQNIFHRLINLHCHSSLFHHLSCSVLYSKYQWWRKYKEVQSKKCILLFFYFVCSGCRCHRIGVLWVSQGWVHGRQYRQAHLLVTIVKNNHHQIIIPGLSCNMLKFIVYDNGDDDVWLRPWERHDSVGGRGNDMTTIEMTNSNDQVNSDQTHGRLVVLL